MDKESAIIICTEKGPLELMSTMLAKSLRLNGGQFSDIPIYSFSPREKFYLGKKAVDSFLDLKVSHQNLPLNNEFQYYALANKPLVCAYAEEKLGYENLIFLDSDVLFIDEPGDLFKFDNFQLLARPVHLQGIGLENPKSKYYSYWNSLYKMADAPLTNEEVITTADRKKIKVYFNSGVLAVKRESLIFKKWKEIFLKAMRMNLKHGKSFFFLEQSTFAVAVASKKIRYKILDHTYNYPVPQHLLLKQNDLHKKLDSIKLLHYHGFENLKLQAENFRDIILAQDKKEWLVKFLGELQILEKYSLKIQYYRQLLYERLNYIVKKYLRF